jgi:hypothetical protein
MARITPSAAVYGRAGCITFQYLQFGRALGIPFTTTTNRFFKCRNVGLSGIQSVRYRNEQKLRCRNQSGTGMLRYRTEKQDAGMPMPAASTSMAMPNYIYCVLTLLYPVRCGDVPADLCGRPAERPCFYYINYVLTLLYPVCCGDVPADLCGRSAERSGHVFHYIYYVLTLLYPVCCGDVPDDLCGRSAERSGHVFYYIY